MIKSLIITLLLILAAMFYYLLYYAPINVSLSEEHRDGFNGVGTINFWTSKRHNNFFKVGQTYQLKAEQYKITMVLFSITYASLKPDAMKLGFTPLKAQNIDTHYTDYRVIELDQTDIK